jgi:hypothetical protein
MVIAFVQSGLANWDGLPLSCSIPLWRATTNNMNRARVRPLFLGPAWQRVSAPFTLSAPGSQAALAIPRRV